MTWQKNVILNLFQDPIIKVATSLVALHILDLPCGVPKRFRHDVFYNKPPNLHQIFWQRNCIGICTMKNITFQNISDSYQLVSGAKIKSKNYDEVYELGEYDGNKRG